MLTAADASYEPSVISSADWDSGLPVLRAVLARMEDLRSGSVLVTETEITFHGDFRRSTDEDGTTGIRSTRRVAEPFVLADLLAEQVGEGEALLIGLRGTRSRHSVKTHARIPYMSDETPTTIEARDLDLHVRVAWSTPRKVRLRAPLAPDHWDRHLPRVCEER